MTTLITGGNGFIGLALAERLRAAGEAVLLADLPRAASAVPAPVPPAGCEAVSGDLREAVTLERLFAGRRIERVVHTAAITPSPQRERDDATAIMDVNVTATARLLQRCAREPSVRRVLLVSSVAVYGFSAPAASGRYEEAGSAPAPASLYGISKLAAEQCALRIGQLHGLDVRVARLGPVFGRWEHASGVREWLSPHHQVLEAACDGMEVVLPRALAADWIYAPDAADALARLAIAATLAHRLYHVGGGGMSDVGQWCEALKRHLPALRWRLAAPHETATVRYGLAADRPALDVSRLTRELGHRCRFTLEEAAADYFAWRAAAREAGSR
ncbi:NAD-dependent epimerase/dehydratase family protein [Trinickia mobilis]|uniref:NAD-dependent epimerase/dehydratase family protein n=1 Tax=Trinickia mobilis TaxID=2816356 RepID=UPI001A8DCD48|nr:NAD(P)-dependent oxidoreductase [Trinickia mobilis]